MESEIIIRSGENRDTETLISFNLALAYETEKIKLSYDNVSSGVRYLLDHPENGFYVIAERKGEVVGSLMVTSEWSDWRNGRYWWFQSVYVSSEYRRQGIFKKLFDHVEALAVEKGNVCGFRLYVERNNKDALETYAAMGLKETPYKMHEKIFY